MELAAEQRTAVAVLIHALGFLGEGLFPAAVQGDDADRETDHEGDPDRRPGP